MNKAMRKDLENVVDAIISEDMETATSSFHDYIRAKTQAILGEASCDSDMSDEDESSDDDKSSEDKPKKGKNPFAKKDEDDASDDDKSEEDSKKKVSESEGSSLGVFNKEVSRARKAKNGPTTPVKKEKVTVGKQKLK